MVTEKSMEASKPGKTSKSLSVGRVLHRGVSGQEWQKEGGPGPAWEETCSTFYAPKFYFTCFVSC